MIYEWTKFDVDNVTKRRRETIARLSHKSIGKEILP
jgi:hypothetical protein